MTGNVILWLEASELYLRHRLDHLTCELLAVDHSLVRYEEISINANREAVIPFDMYLEGFETGDYTVETPQGRRTIHGRPMPEARLTIGPALAIATEGNPDAAPPLLQEMSIVGNSLVLDLLDSRIAIGLGDHPKATLQITDRVRCYTLSTLGMFRKYIREPWDDLPA